jgi:hypothetical protein
MRASSIARLVALAAALATYLGGVGRLRALQPSSPLAASPGAAAYLDVLRTRADVDQAAAQLARADALLQRAMLSPSEHEERRAAYVRARLAHVGAVVSAAASRARLTIARAVKSRSADGRLRVALTLRNDAPRLDAAALGNAIGGAIGEGVDPAAWTTVRGAVVALKTDAGANGATISRPYERAVPEVPAGAERVVSLELLEDVADVVVAIDAGGRADERRIRLEIAAAANAIAVDAAQFSLAGDLGSQVVYDLRLQRPGPSAASTRLTVRGLPVEVTHEFRDPDRGTRLGQLRFPDGATAARVQLALALPARPSSAVMPDAPIAFDVVAADGRAAGRARLELVPRGLARIELRPATLALQAPAGGETTLALTVRNAGTGRVDDVRLRAEPPARWHATIEPAAIASLAPGDEARVRLVVRPPADAVGGDYELRVGVDDAGPARRVEVEDKLIRVRVGSTGGLAAPIAGVAAVVALALVAVVYGRRWVNR